MISLGLPSDLTWYVLLRDWGSFIGGGLALIAGLLAYGAGRRQARETRRAAELQAKTANVELEHLRDAQAENDRRTRNGLLAALDAEAARIPMMVHLRCEVAKKRHGVRTNLTVTQPELYKILRTSVLDEPGIVFLLHGNIRLAAIELRSGIEILNELINTKGLLLNELQGQELIDALSRVHAAAVKLQQALGDHGGDRRIGFTSKCHRPTCPNG